METASLAVKPHEVGDVEALRAADGGTVEVEEQQREARTWRKTANASAKSGRRRGRGGGAAAAPAEAGGRPRQRRSTFMPDATDLPFGSGHPPFGEVHDVEGCAIIWNPTRAVGADGRVRDGVERCLTYEHYKPRHRIFFDLCRNLPTQKWRLDGGCLRLSAGQYCLAANSEQAWLDSPARGLYLGGLAGQRGTSLRRMEDARKDGRPFARREEDAKRPWLSTCLEHRDDPANRHGVRLQECQDSEAQTVSFQCR